MKETERRALSALGQAVAGLELALLRLERCARGSARASGSRQRPRAEAERTSSRDRKRSAE